MGRPLNEEKRKSVKLRHEELLRTELTASAAVKRQAEERGVTEQNIYYLLRDRLAPGQKRDRRTKRVSQDLALMTLAEIKTYALKTGRSWRYLYALSLKGRSGVGIIHTPAELRLVEIQHENMFDFSSVSDLKAVGRTIDEVRLARRTLKAAYGLSLVPPNLLVHVEKNRQYPLNYPQQCKIIRAPKDFIRLNAVEIGKNWKPIEEEVEL